MKTLKEPMLPGTPSTACSSSDSEDSIEQGIKDSEQDMERGVKDSPCASASVLKAYQWHVFLLYGSAMLMPFNAMLSSVDYFAAKFGAEFQFMNAIFLTTPQFLVMFFTAFVQKPSNTTGAFWGYVGLCTACLLIPFLENRTSVLVAAAVIGFFNSIAQTAMNGLGSHSPELIPALQTGLGLAGVMASGTRILTKATLGVELGTQLYFGLSALMCVAAVALLRMHPEKEPSVTAASKASCGVLRSLRLLPLTFFLNFMVTLAFFPGLLATIAPRDIGRTLTNGWWPVLLVAGFNIFDFTGKYFANFAVAQFHVQWGAFKLLALQSVRMVLVYVMAYVASADLMVCVLVAVLAFTNGWFGSAGFCIQHKMLEPEQRDQAAVISTFFILFGITAGSFLGQAAFD